MLEEDHKMQVPREWPADAGRPVRDQLAAGGKSGAQARSRVSPDFLRPEERGPGTKRIFTHK